MNKKIIIRKNEEIKSIIDKNEGKKVSCSFIIYYRKNILEHNRYCISVSKKIGKANIRNLYKRRVKNILVNNSIFNTNDYVIILRSAILKKDYKEIEKELINNLKGEI